MSSKIKLVSRALCFLLGVFSAQTILAQSLQAQSLQDRADKIRSTVDNGNLQIAVDELLSFKHADAPAFALNNYDYLLARLSEALGDRAASSSGYQALVARRSLLTQYGLWHLAQLARSSGDLVQERERLRQLIFSGSTSLLRDAATMRLAESFFESTDYTGAAETLRPLTESKKTTVARHALARMAEAYLGGGKRAEARELFTRLVTQMPDASPVAVRTNDAVGSPQ